MKILVVGGNGFIGSAVCRAALAKGFQVTSVSSSGRPYRTPKGHSPAWTSKVTWLRGNAFQPSSFAHIVAEVDAVVHTLGTLIEGATYKQSVRDGNLIGLLSSIVGRNPLTRHQDTSYERMNRDSALAVCEAFIASGRDRAYPKSRAFVFVSAEDIFRPVISARYITTKREAEKGLDSLIKAENASSTKTVAYRGVYVRPGLVYHAHLRPLTTPVAALLDLSATIHSKVPEGFPTPSGILRYFGSARAKSSPSLASPLEDQATTSSFLGSMANALTVPPIHVDQVAQAICVALNAEIDGVVDVLRMRELLRWSSHSDADFYHAAQ